MAEKIGYYFKNVADLSLVDTPAFADASAEDLRVLLALILCDCDISRKELQERALCDAETVTGALQYWRGAGVLAKGKKAKETAIEEKEEEKEETKAKTEDSPAEKKKKTIESPDKFSHTPSDKLAREIDRDHLQTLIEACQQTVGKTLSTSDINIIVGMHRELSLDGDYIITLISYCFENERRSLKYVEKMAFVLTGQGIVTEEDLVQYIDDRRRFATFEWQLKKKFGMGNRDFTKKQESLVHKWEKEYDYPIDVVTMAFDITVDSINKADFSYMDAILSKWHAAGCRTEADVTAFTEKEAAKRKTSQNAQTEKKTEQKSKNSTVGNSSFDTDDFFNRALERSYKK